MSNGWKSLGLAPSADTFVVLNTVGAELAREPLRADPAPAGTPP